MSTRTRAPAVLPTSLIGRLIAALLAIALAVAGLFFIAFALVAAAMVAAVVAARMWWVFRKLRTQQNAQVIEGIYSVESEQVHVIDAKDSTRSVPPTDKK